MLVHNHPSGDPTPSPDDLHLTAEALAAGRLLDIDLLDHVVIASGGYISLRDRGVTFRPCPEAGGAGMTGFRRSVTLVGALEGNVWMPAVTAQKPCRPTSLASPPRT